jgi:hypothetical protein
MWTSELLWRTTSPTVFLKEKWESEERRNIMANIMQPPPPE